uniref:beta strand repeat-containing protein n=1 Tax=Psychrobacter sanguinis TaxID=861445 RepID=UPI0019183E3F
ANVEVPLNTDGTQVQANVSIVDAASNSTAGTPATALVDTTAPATAPTVAFIGDSNGDGTFNKDEVGTDGTVTAVITAPADAVAGDTIVITDGNGNVVKNLVVGTDIAVGGTANVEVPLNTDGTQVQANVSIVDAASNSTAGTPATALVDTTAPATATTSITVNDLTDDDVINAAEAGGDVVVTGTVTGEFTKGDEVTISVNGTDYTGTVDVDGNFSINVPGTELVADADKVIDASVVATDAAGNTGTVDTTKDYSVDTTTMQPTGKLPEDVTNDTGSSATDNITKNTTPTLTGMAEANAAINVEVNGKTYTTTADELGNWSVKVTTALPGSAAGISYTPIITATDKAGNTATANGETFIVDTAVGTTSAGLKHDAVNDTGSSTSDNYTNNPTPVYEGYADPGATVTVTHGSIGGTYTTTADANGYWAVQFTGGITPAPAGTRNLIPTISVTDVAGNTKDVLGTAFTYDSKAPAAGNLSLANWTDSGVQGDNRSNDNTYDLSLSGQEAGSSVVYQVSADNGATWTTTTIAQSNVADGNYQYRAIVTDAAGNSATTRPLTNIVDTTATMSEVTIQDSATLNNPDNSIVYADLIAGTPTRTVTGTTTGVEAGQVVNVTLNDANGHTVTATTTTAANGSWQTGQLDFTSFTQGSTVTATATVTDVAGNTASGSDTTAINTQAAFTVANASANEGSNLVFNATVTQTGIIAAPVLTNVTTSSADFGSLTPVYSGAVTQNSDGTLTATGNFTISYSTVADQSTEGAETVTLNLGTRSATGTINDTSLTVASISVNEATAYENPMSSTSLAPPDRVDPTKMVYTVTLAQPSFVPIDVVVNLSGEATNVTDYTVSDITSGNISDNIITLRFAPGQTSQSFTVNAVDDTAPVNAGFGGEGNETVVATLAIGQTGYSVGSAGSVSGLIIDSDPFAITNLRGDMNMYVGPTLANNGDRAQSVNGINTTDYRDVIYIGYDRRGNLLGYGNISNSLAETQNSNTDGKNSTTTVDTAGGDDFIRLAGQHLTLSTLYMGEGDDRYEIRGGDIYGNTAIAFLESGNDTFDGEGINGGSLYTGSGSDTVIMSGRLYKDATIDLGSGTPLPSQYDTTVRTDPILGITGIQFGTLAEQANQDSVSDINTVKLAELNGTIRGGVGQDRIEATTSIGDVIYSNVNITLGDNDDRLITPYMSAGSVNMGNGNDTVTFGQMSGGTILLGGGADNMTINGVLREDIAPESVFPVLVRKRSLIDMGADNDTLTINGDVNDDPEIYMGTGNDILSILGNINGGTFDLGDGNDVFNYSGSDIRGAVNAGTGNDTFNFTGSGQVLYVNDTTGFERFNLNNSGGELNLSYSDLTSAGTRIVFIDGGTRDTLDLGSNGQQNDNTETRIVDNNFVISGNDTFWVLQPTSDQVGYDKYVYTGSASSPNSQGYTVYVDTDITVI